MRKIFVIGFNNDAVSKEEVAILFEDFSNTEELFGSNVVVELVFV